MTDEKAQAILDVMIECWPDLPNPEHEPRRFEYYCKMFNHCHPDKIREINERLSTQ